MALAETLKEQSERVPLDQVPPVDFIPDAGNHSTLPVEKQVDEEQDYLRKKLSFLTLTALVASILTFHMREFNMADKDLVTLGVVKALLEVQANACKESFRLMFDDGKEELRNVKKDIVDLKKSLSFSQGQLHTTMKSVQELEVKTSFPESTLSEMQDSLVACEDNIEFLENKSRHNNMELIGIPENESESWDESIEIFKSQVKNALKSPDDLDIERTHRVGQKRQFFTRRDGSRVKTNPRPIVAKFKDWKQKEKVTNAAKKLRPVGMKFVDDFSKRTLEKRFVQQTELNIPAKKGSLPILLSIA